MPGPVNDVLSCNHLSVVGWVEHYCRHERNPALPPFKISDRPLDRAEVKSHELANKPGCYVIFTEAGNLKYVGMSWKRIGPRSLSHFGYFNTVAFWMKSTRPSFVTLIAVQKDWEALSLEGYLTDETAKLREIANAELAGSSP